MAKATQSPPLQQLLLLLLSRNVRIGLANRESRENYFSLLANGLKCVKLERSKNKRIFLTPDDFRTWTTFSTLNIIRRSIIRWTTVSHTFLPDIFSYFRLVLFLPSGIFGVNGNRSKIRLKLPSLCTQFGYFYENSLSVFFFS